MHELPHMLTVRQVAELLSCTPAHVRRLIERGLLRAVKLTSPESCRITQQSRYRIFADSVAELLGIRHYKTKPRLTKAVKAQIVAELAMLGIEPPS